MFNEKIFIFLWFWFVIVACCTCSNFIFWLYRALFLRERVSYIKKYLKIMEEVRSEDDKKLVRKFADQYLRDDGCFVLRIIARNSNDILLSDIIRAMWKIYKDKPLIKKSMDAENNDHHNENDNYGPNYTHADSHA